ncbi:MAG: hypothetical protein ACFFCW_45465 [Candidatus Hodarchaeota archaeon]
MTTKLYEQLLKVWRENRTGEVQLKLPEDFYPRSSALIRNFQKPIDNPIENAIQAIIILRMQFLLQDTLLMRLSKILEIIKEKRPLDPSLLTPEEVKFITLIKEGDFFVEGASAAITGKTQGLNIDGRKFTLVRILENLPAIIGTDLATYGPFKKEDVALIPYDNAQILIVKKMATEIHMTD